MAKLVAVTCRENLSTARKDSLSSLSQPSLSQLKWFILALKGLSFRNHYVFYVYYFKSAPMKVWKWNFQNYDRWPTDQQTNQRADQPTDTGRPGHRDVSLPIISDNFTAYIWKIIKINVLLHYVISIIIQYSFCMCKFLIHHLNTQGRPS